MAWERTKNLVRAFIDCGENVVMLTMSRFLRDMQEYQRPVAPPAGEAVTVVFGFLDVAVATIFVIVAFTVLVTSRRETPRMPFRLWIFVFALQCVGHLAWLYVKHYSQFHQQLRVDNIIKHVEYGKDLAYFAWWLLGLSWLLKSNGYDEFAPQLTRCVLGCSCGIFCCLYYSLLFAAYDLYHFSLFATPSPGNSSSKHTASTLPIL